VAANCAPGVFNHDFNCDGVVEIVGSQEPIRPACNAMPNAISAAECNARDGFTQPPVCGVARTVQNCTTINGVCQFPPAAPVTSLPVCR
jgi:hypothetical protein